MAPSSSRTRSRASTSRRRRPRTSASPTPRTERARERAHGKVREAIDDADDVLVEPFSGVITSGSIWAKRAVTTLLALLVYGLLARVLIAYIPGRR